MKNLTIIVKPVGSGCNMRCVYCYNNPDRDFTEIDHMNPELYRLLITQLSQMNLRLLTLMYHGGEPLLAGFDFYNSAMQLHQELLADVQVRYLLQTNGTRITPKWAKFFAENKFDVGISIDGPKHVHDLQRRDLAGNGTFDQVMRGIRLMRNAGLRFGTNAVITKYSLQYAVDIYEFFKNEELLSCDFSPCAEYDLVSGQMFPFSLTPQEYADFMLKLFEIWLEEDNPEYDIRRFREYIQASIGGYQELCVFQHVCGSYIAVELDGYVFICGRFAGTDASRIGNIRETPLSELLESERFKAITAEMNSDKEQCKDCKWEPHCKGGCTYYRFFNTGSFSGNNYFCEAHRRMFGRIDELVSPIATELAEVEDA